jgi:predicted RNA binding protein YcfA (HicA-like mRNA interferase family)
METSREMFDTQEKIKYNFNSQSDRLLGIFGSTLAICYPCRMKVNEILMMLKVDGWYLAATRGSHRQFKHPVKSGRVTVPGKPSDDLAPGTLNSILKQAKLKE